MKIKNKIAIGCLVQFYEIDIIEDYLKSVKYAREDIENKENIEVDICLNLNQGLEQLDESKINMLDINHSLKINSFMVSRKIVHSIPQDDAIFLLLTIQCCFVNK